MAKQPDRASLGKIVAKSWNDEAFKQRLLADPAGVLKEEGFELPKGVTIKAVANTADVIHLVIPDKPPTEELLKSTESEALACKCWQGEAWV
jgi:Nitrile hydratase, alpha chain